MVRRRLVWPNSVSQIISPGVGILLLFFALEYFITPRSGARTSVAPSAWVCTAFTSFDARIHRCFFLVFMPGQNLASREIQRPGQGVKNIGAQLWALKMISGYILTVLILDFFLSLLLWNDVDCVTGALQGERYVQWFGRSFGDSRFSVTLVSGVTLYILSSAQNLGGVVAILRFVLHHQTLGLCPYDVYIALASRICDKIVISSIFRVSFSSPRQQLRDWLGAIMLGIRFYAFMHGDMDHEQFEPDSFSARYVRVVTCYFSCKCRIMRHRHGQGSNMLKCALTKSQVSFFTHNYIYKSF